MKNRMTIDTKNVKSYATEAKLDEVIKQKGLDKYRHVICKNADNRWTAIFTDPDANVAIFCGFMWVR